MKKELSQTKFAIKMRERRARRRAAGQQANRRNQDDVLSHEYLTRANFHATGALRYLA